MGARILVIKLGALGDFVQALGPMAAIRAHHQDAHITVLTTAAFAAFAAASPYFDQVWIDDRPRLWNVPGWLALRARLRGGGFDRVYDLQTSDRTGFYFRLLGSEPEWSGIAAGCSHPHTNPARDGQHTLDRQAEQLAMAGILSVPPPDLGWVRDDVARLDPLFMNVDGGVSAPYALLVPGGAAHRVEKRWSADHFATVAEGLSKAGIRPVLLGADADRAAMAVIGSRVPDAVDLCARTSFADIAVLARGARLAIGNDTGPMHLIAATGIRAVVLFSAVSDPALCAPRGAGVVILRSPRLADLASPAVLDAALS